MFQGSFPFFCTLLLPPLLAAAYCVASGYTTSRELLRDAALEGRSLRALDAVEERGEVGLPLVVRLSAISILLHACVRADTWSLMSIIQRDILFWPSYRGFFLNSRGLSTFCLPKCTRGMIFFSCLARGRECPIQDKGVAEHRLILFVPLFSSAPVSSFFSSSPRYRPPDTRYPSVAQAQLGGPY